MSLLFDTHCHFASLDSFPDQVRVAHPNISQFLSVATRPADWALTFERCAITSSIAALGIHPWFVSETTALDLVHLEEYFSTGKVQVMGEIGLDFFGGYAATRLLQLTCFNHQVDLAEKYGLPVSIHARKSFSDLISILKARTILGVFHGFSGGQVLAEQLIALGYKIGVNTTILNPTARRYHELVKGIGLSNMVLETDAPFGHVQGHETQLKDLVLIAQQVANLLQCPYDEVAEITTHNAQEIFENG